MKSDLIKHCNCHRCIWNIRRFILLFYCYLYMALYSLNCQTKSVNKREIKRKVNSAKGVKKILLHLKKYLSAWLKLFFVKNSFVYPFWWDCSQQRKGSRNIFLLQGRSLLNIVYVSYQRAPWIKLNYCMKDFFMYNRLL